MNTKFTLNQYVKDVKTDKQIGKIVGILTYVGYCTIAGEKRFYNTKEKWDILFPGWNDKNAMIYFILLDEPQLQCTEDDIRKQCLKISEEEIKKRMSALPFVNMITVPENAIKSI